jgi:hypothetical protein
MVGVGRYACAGGGARRRRGVRPIQGTIDQSNGSESFTKDQGRGVREELENGSPECPVYVRRRAAKVRWGRSSPSGEVLLGPRAWKASRAIGGANRSTGATWGVTGVGWPRWPRLWRQWRAGRSSPELRRGVWPAMVSAGWSEVRQGRLYRRGRARPRAGLWQALGACAANASARSGVWHNVEHEAAQREVEFKCGLTPNLWDYGHDPIERSLPLRFLCRLCVEASRFGWLDQEIERGEILFVSLPHTGRRSLVWRVQGTRPDAIFWHKTERLVRHVFVNGDIRIWDRDQGEHAWSLAQGLKFRILNFKIPYWNPTWEACLEFYLNCFGQASLIFVVAYLVYFNVYNWTKPWF